jgi:hypothetical protein
MEMRDEGCKNIKKQGSFGKKFVELETVVEMLGKTVQFLENQMAPILDPVQKTNEQSSIMSQETGLAPVTDSLEAIRARIQDIIKVITNLTARLAL